MNFRASINIMTKPEILDPQGKAVLLGLSNLGVHAATDVRVGKHLTMDFAADNEAAAREIVDTACRQLLANLIMEKYEYTLEVV